jgi:hypothetical protein
MLYVGTTTHVAYTAYRAGKEAVAPAQSTHAVYRSRYERQHDFIDNARPYPASRRGASRHGVERQSGAHALRRDPQRKRQRRRPAGGRPVGESAGPWCGRKHLPPPLTTRGRSSTGGGQDPAAAAAERWGQQGGSQVARGCMLLQQPVRGGALSPRRCLLLTLLLLLLSLQRNAAPGPARASAAATRCSRCHSFRLRRGSGPPYPPSAPSCTTSSWAATSR